MSDEAMRQLPEAQHIALETNPASATLAFAVATTTGIFGSVLLLMRLSWAVPLFLDSLTAVFAQMYHAYVLSNAFDLSGTAGVLQTAPIIGIAVALIWYARDAKEKGRFR